MESILSYHSKLRLQEKSTPDLLKGIEANNNQESYLCDGSVFCTKTNEDNIESAVRTSGEPFFGNFVQIKFTILIFEKNSRSWKCLF